MNRWGTVGESSKRSNHVTKRAKPKTKKKRKKGCGFFVWSQSVAPLNTGILGKTRTLVLMRESRTDSLTGKKQRVRTLLRISFFSRTFVLTPRGVLLPATPDWLFPLPYGECDLSVNSLEHLAEEEEVELSLELGR